MDRRNILAALAERRWAILPQALESLAARLVSIPENLSEAKASVQDDRRASLGYYVEEGVAVIEIVGTISKQVPWCADWMGIEATSTIAVRQALDAALKDPDVKSIFFLVDSPGGTVDGTQELADAIFQARGIKPMHAQVSDLCCSGALWLASQADTISANETAMVGSIGVYGVMDDFSQMYANEGVTVHVISSGPYKGVGVQGAPISEEQLAPEREIINGLADLFIQAVARGRGMSVEAVKALATGRVWLASEAQALGLIDAVENAEDALSRVAGGEPGRFATQAATQGGEANMLKLKALFGKKVSPEAAVDAGAATDVEEDTTKETTETEKEKEPVIPVEEAAEQDEAGKPAGVEASAAERDFLELVDLIGAEAAAQALKDKKSHAQALADEIKRLKAELANKSAIIKTTAALGEETPASVTSDEDMQAGAKQYENALGKNLGRTAAAFAQKLRK